MTQHPLTKEFLTQLANSTSRMCQQIIADGDSHEAIEMLGEAFVFYMEMAILTALPLTPEDIRQHGEPLVKAAREHLQVASGMIAVDRLYQMGRDE